MGHGPWYCHLCRGWLLLNGSTDPVEDLVLLDYLFRGRIPDDDGQYDRVRALEGTYRARGEELETLVFPSGSTELARWVPVPPVCMRPQLIRDMHEALAHAGTPKLWEAMIAKWWWPKLRADVLVELRACPMC
mgnify:FL=1